MADLRESFPVLENPTTQAGVPWSSVAAGDAAAGKNAGPVLVCKDASGNLQYIPLNSDNKIPVALESDIVNLTAQGKIAGNAAETLVAEITLQVSTVYRKLGWIASCFRDAAFRIYHLDDAAENDLAEISCGPGDFTDSNQLDGVTFTTGATGTQKLVIEALNLNALSDLKATLSIDEVQ